MVGIVLRPGEAMPSPEEQARIVAAGNKIIEEYHKKVEEHDKLCRGIAALEGEHLKETRDTHVALEGLMSELKTGPGTTVMLHGGLVMVEVTRCTNTYNEDFVYTWLLNVYLHTGYGTPKHKIKRYAISDTPKDILMAYIQALSDALKMTPTKPRPVLRTKQVLISA